MKSTLRIISGLALLTGLGVCGLWVVASVLGEVEPGDAVAIVGLPIAAVGAIGTVLTGQLREHVHHLFNS